MKAKDLECIEKIVMASIELKIMTEDKDAEYFYDRLEMNVLLELLEEVAGALACLSDEFKEKYPFMNWDFIEEARYYDRVFGMSMKVSKAWDLASTMYDEIYSALIDILKIELPIYYHECVVSRQKQIQSEKKIDD